MMKRRDKQGKDKVPEAAHQSCLSELQEALGKHPGYQLLQAGNWGAHGVGGGRAGEGQTGGDGGFKYSA